MDAGVAQIVVKRVLMIAFHYPPVRGSSGLQRTLSFANHLPDEGWKPIVLSAHPRAYLHCGDDQLQDIRDGTSVYRAFALNSAKHLSIRGHYSRLMTLPDRWVAWWLGAVPSALFLIRKYRPNVIWSTYPIATAHLIGLTLHRLTGLPWVADFRDSMTEANYPEDETRRRVFLWIERHAVKASSRAVFTTPGAVDIYSKRYPELPSERWALITNGFNEEIFQEVEKSMTSRESEVERNQRMTLLHSGVLYPSERDPTFFFAALSDLKRQNRIDHKQIRIVLRATGHDEIFRPMLKDYDIEDIVELASAISYREALSEMLSADGLILFQASNCNHQIPAKLYEYLRARRPVLGLTDPAGDTARVLEEAGMAELARLDDKAMISQAILNFLHRMRSGLDFKVNESIVKQYSRRSATTDLAGVFNEVCRN